MSTKTRVYPVITKEVETIASLEIQSGAQLAIGEKGQLNVDGGHTYREGIQNTHSTIAIFIAAHG